ncbi:DivIVA domain-containing protein [Nocardioides pantholopis]|uniref:DivIVA domain-containing protein n=1 Tax=Nocardioides pantholopis TaxID=2483798 RepID=UPI001F49CFDC|nr:DivIVA domain-containing protein [Nocardioides pantholopis]
MMWFFAVVIVLALGAVAVVAAGRGEPMTPPAPERTPSGLPRTGPLSAQDLRTVRFPLAFRGYRMADVDDLLDRLAAEREQEQAQPAPRPAPGAVGDTGRTDGTEPPRG